MSTHIPILCTTITIIVIAMLILSTSTVIIMMRILILGTLVSRVRSITVILVKRHALTRISTIGTSRVTMTLATDTTTSNITTSHDTEQQAGIPASSVGFGCATDETELCSLLLGAPRHQKFSVCCCCPIYRGVTPESVTASLGRDTGELDLRGARVSAAALGRLGFDLVESDIEVCAGPALV